MGYPPILFIFNHQDTSENTLGHLIPNRLVRAAAYKVAKESKAIKIITGVGVDSFSIDANKAEIKLSNKRNHPLQSDDRCRWKVVRFKKIHGHPI